MPGPGAIGVAWASLRLDRCLIMRAGIQMSALQKDVTGGSTCAPGQAFYLDNG